MRRLMLVMLIVVLVCFSALTLTLALRTPASALKPDDLRPGPGGDVNKGPVTKSPPNVHDLVITRMKPIENCVTTAGKKCWVSIQVTVKNQGTVVAMTTPAQFFLGAQVFDETTNQALGINYFNTRNSRRMALAPGQIKTGQFQLSFYFLQPVDVSHPSGPLRLRAWVDMENFVKEFNENNNYKDIPLSCPATNECAW